MIPSRLSAALWQYQPTTTSHDPNPPLPLEDVPVPPPATTVKPLAALGVG